MFRHLVRAQRPNLLPVAWLLASIVLTSTALAVNAATIPVSSYGIFNGHTGSYSYWDESYAPPYPGSPPNCRMTDDCFLFRGTGDLTDGVIATSSWDVAEAPVGNGPYVGWSLFRRDPVPLSFYFSAPVTIGSATFYLDDSNGVGGVMPPSSITIQAGTFLQSFAVTDPTSGAPFAFTANLPNVVANSVSASMNYGTGARYVFLSEVTFNSPAVAAIPEPSTYALMLAGLGIVAFVAKRRRKSQIAVS